MNQMIIQQAIAEKRLLEFSYSNLPRVIEPHVLGVSDGVMQVLGYQIGGSSSSGGLPEWRRFDLPKIVRLKLGSKTFPGRRLFPSGKHSVWDRQISVVS